MKVFMLLTGLFLFTHPGVRNDLTRQNLKGRVKSLTHCQFPVFYGKIDTNWSTIYVFKYDELGNQVEDADYTGGSLLTGFGRLNHRRVYKYDANGNQTEVFEFKADGSLQQKVVYEYDADGKRTARKNYNPDGKLWRRSVFKYNDRGQQVECNKYNEDSVLLEQFTYKYDTKGNQVGELLYVARISDTAGYSTKPFQSDTVGNSRVVRLDYVKAYTFDDSGKKIQEVNNTYGSTFPFTTTYQYAGYDAEGNWLRELFIENNKPTNVIDRVIEYY